MLFALSLLLSTAPAATQSYEFDEFTKVRSSSSVDMLVRVDPSAKTPFLVEFSGEQSALDRLDVKSEEGALLVKAKKSSWGSWSGGNVKMRTTVRNLEAIDLTGSGDFRATNLQGDAIQVRCAGSGDVSLGGEVGDLTIKISGSGDVEASEVDGDQVRIKIAGSGGVKLAGRAETLKISIAGSGDVDADSLEVSDVDASIMGSGDISVCASGTVTENTMGSGDVENTCD